MNHESIERLMYVSRAVQTLRPPDVESLVMCSQERNATEGITGALLFTGQHFSQTIEGPRGAVERIFRSISDDPRHEALHVLFRRAVPVRRFDRWRMAYLRFDAMDRIVEEFWESPDPHGRDAAQLENRILGGLKPCA